MLFPRLLCLVSFFAAMAAAQTMMITAAAESGLGKPGGAACVVTTTGMAPVAQPVPQLRTAPPPVLAPQVAQAVTPSVPVRTSKRKFKAHAKFCFLCVSVGVDSDDEDHEPLPNQK